MNHLCITICCLYIIILGQPRFRNDKTFLHLDQGANRLGLHAYQSGVYLEESSTSDHCFRVLKGSHKFIKEFYDHFPLAAKESSSMEYYELRDEEIKWYSDLGCLQATVPVPRGGMVLWDSRLVHDNARPIKGRPNSDRWRHVVFVCMTPAKWAKQSDIKMKRTAYENLLLTTHWPSQNVTTMQSSYKSYDTYPAPSPLRRSLTTLPWRPSTYYQTARVNPSSALTRSVPEPFSAKNQLSDLDNVKVPPVFAAARNALYTRYTPNDWMTSNQGNYLASDRVRSLAERLRLDTVRLCRETDDKTKRTQSDVGKRLGERLGDIQFWKTEVQHETDNMITEINALQEAKRVLEKSLAETENPLHISQECLYHREKRQAIDLVHDNPERELIKVRAKF